MYYLTSATCSSHVYTLFFSYLFSFSFPSRVVVAAVDVVVAVVVHVAVVAATIAVATLAVVVVTASLGLVDTADWTTEVD